MAGRSFLRNTLKNLPAIALGLALLPLIEFLLSLAGATRLSDEDPFVGFAGSRPLFAEAPDVLGTYRLSPGKERFFNPQTFRMPKPTGVFRIVAFGGSTTYGHPYTAETAFPSWMTRILGHYDLSRTYESINAGGVSYASYRVRRLVEELSRFSPDLYVVFSGHNEFLEARTFGELLAESPTRRRLRSLLHRSRLYSAIARLVAAGNRGAGPAGRTVLGAEVGVTLEEVGGPWLYHRDQDFREGVVRQYRFNIEAIARFCRKKRIPLVLCTLPSNLSGLVPFKSEHRAGLGAAERAGWDRAVEAARTAFFRGELAPALSLLQEAEAIDDRYARLHYLKGEVLRALGRTGEARASYVRAKEEDIVPVRALEVFNDIVRDVAHREKIPLADIAQRFDDLAPAGIPGESLFVDHVHPYIEGHLEIALSVIETAASNGLVPLAPARLEAGRLEVRALLADRLTGITPRYRALGLYVAGRTLRWAGLYREAYQLLTAAWRTVRDEPELPYLLGELELYFGRPEAALPYYRHALEQRPNDGDYLIGSAKASVALGDAPAALSALERVGKTSGNEPIALKTRGEAKALQGDLAGARRDLEDAARQAPKVPAFLVSLSRIRLLDGDEKGARESFRRSLELQGEPWSEAAYADLKGKRP